MQLDSFADFCRISFHRTQISRIMETSLCPVWLCPWGQWHQEGLFIDVFQPNLFARIEPGRIWSGRVYFQFASASFWQQGFLLVLVIFVLKVKVVPPIYGFKLLQWTWVFLIQYHIVNSAEHWQKKKEWGGWCCGRGGRYWRTMHHTPSHCGWYPEPKEERIEKTKEGMTNDEEKWTRRLELIKVD